MFYQEIIDVNRFHDLIEDAARDSFPCSFRRVVVVDYGEGFRHERVG
jgi:hypothetical protein